MSGPPGSVLIAAAFALSGCATIQPERGHAEVAQLVEKRIGLRTHWDQGSPADALVAARVAALLQGGLTRERAIEVALVNNPSLQATYEELGVSQADLVQAGLLSNPVLAGSVGFRSGRGRVEYESSLVQSFLDIFVLPLRKRVAREQFTADTLKVAHEALEVAARVSGRFATAQAQVRVLELSRLSLQVSQAAAELAERQHRAGNITELALAREQAAHQQAKLDLARTEIELAEGREELNRLLGLWGPETGWAIAGALPDLPPEEVPLDGLESAALRQRLDVDAARKQTLLLANAVELARTSRAFGVLEVGVHVHQDPDGPRLFGPTLSVELPLFDQRQAVIARLEAQQRQANRRLAALAIDARSSVRLARARLMVARQGTEHYRSVLLPLRERIVEHALLQYNGMQIGLARLLDAKRAQLEAEHGHIEVLRDYWIARAELERVMGGRVAAPEGATADHAGNPEEGRSHEHDAR